MRQPSGKQTFPTSDKGRDLTLSSPPNAALGHAYDRTPKPPPTKKPPACGGRLLWLIDGAGTYQR
jgi:hypothetical protein